MLSRVHIHRYLGKSELTFPSFGATIDEIEDLQQVSAYEEDEVSNIQSTSIIGVNILETTYICVNCKKPLSPTSTIAHCDHCATNQKLRNPKVSAKLFVEDQTGRQFTLRAHTQFLCDITRGSPITVEELLNATPFNVAYNKYHVVTNISRE